MRRVLVLAFAVCALLFAATVGLAQQPAAPEAPAAAAAAAPAKLTIDKGDTAWMLTSSALVLLMTAPGLALFYGGMVRQKNALATLMHSFIILCLISIQWILWGYSLAFGRTRAASPAVSSGSACAASAWSRTPRTRRRSRTRCTWSSR